MTFQQVDWLVYQWWIWASTDDNAIKKLSESRAKWQDQYRPPIDPENQPVRRHDAIDEEVASLVDRVMAELMNEVPNIHWRCWLARMERDPTVYGPSEISNPNDAYEQFLKYFQKVLSKAEQLRLNYVRGRRHA